MFTWQHFIWLFICLVFVIVIVRAYERKIPTLTQVLTSACVVCALSEVMKVMGTIEMVPSANGGIIYPYLPVNHLPLHFCSIQILFIFYARLTRNETGRANMLAFIAPTAVLGAIVALLLPSIFTTSVSPARSFVSPMAYQFFVFHAMLIALGIIIIRSGEIVFTKKHLLMTVLTIWLFGFISIYFNSIFASPTYVDGQLVSVDFWTNFFFTNQNPLNIILTAKWQWILYLFIITLLSGGLISLFYKVFLLRRK